MVAATERGNEGTCTVLRAALLHENGIRSLNNLAATAPDVLVRLFAVNKEMAVSFVDQAKRRLIEET